MKKTDLFFMNRYLLLAALSFIVILALLVAFTSQSMASAFNDPMPRAAGGAAIAGGDLVPVTPTVDGGQISVGSTGQVVVLFRNDSGHALVAGDIQLYPSSTVSADIVANQCAAEDLAASAVCAVSVSIKGVLAGAWRVEMLMRHNGRAKLATAAMAGTVVAGEGVKGGFISDIQAIPDKLDFGDVISGQPVIRSLMLRNSTAQPIDISAVNIEAADKAGFTVKTDCARVAPGQACIAIVTWSPVLAGQATGILVVNHNGSTKVASIDLTGKFAPAISAEAQTFPDAVPGKGLLVASQKDVDFGSDIETTSAITVSLVNVGDAPLTIRDLRLANADSGLSISKKGCAVGTVLDPVDACPLTLTWSPVREGSILGDVEIAHDGARGILVLPIKGTAKGAISQDSKALRLAGAGTGNLDTSVGKLSPLASSRSARNDNVDPASVLDGFIVTSHAPRRAIISGPGGSRIVFDGQDIVLGGFAWHVAVRPSGVEFHSDSEKVLLLFDTSLTSVARAGAPSETSPAVAAMNTANNVIPAPLPATPVKSGGKS